MSWAKLDDQFPQHPKVVMAGGDAGWLHVCALCYCASHLTDGKFPKAIVSRLSDRKGAVPLASRLVEVGMWDDLGDQYEIHDYLKYNPSREQVIAEREKAKERRAASGGRGGRRSGDVRATDARENEAPTRPDVPTEQEKPPKRRNLSFDALAECWPSQTRAEKSRIAAALRELVGADDVTPDELRTRSKRLHARAKTEGWNAPTVMALPARWSELAGPVVVLSGNGERYVGPTRLPECSGCGRLEVDCTCGVIVHDFRQAKESA